MYLAIVVSHPLEMFGSLPIRGNADSGKTRVMWKAIISWKIDKMNIYYKDDRIVQNCEDNMNSSGKVDLSPPSAA